MHQSKAEKSVALKYLRAALNDSYTREDQKNRTDFEQLCVLPLRADTANIPLPVCEVSLC